MPSSITFNMQLIDLVQIMIKMVLEGLQLDSNPDVYLLELFFTLQIHVTDTPQTRDIY